MKRQLPPPFITLAELLRPQRQTVCALSAWRCRVDPSGKTNNARATDNIRYKEE